MQAVIFTALVQAPCALLHQSPNFWHLRKESQIFTVQHIFNAKTPRKRGKISQTRSRPLGCSSCQHALSCVSSSSQSCVLGLSTENLSPWFGFWWRVFGTDQDRPNAFETGGIYPSQDHGLILHPCHVFLWNVKQPWRLQTRPWVCLFWALQWREWQKLMN